MYTGLKGVQVEIRWGRRSHRREFRQAKMRLGVGEKNKTNKPQHQGIRGKDKSIHRRKARQNNHQNKPEVE